jgi:hypothetical protein
MFALDISTSRRIALTIRWKRESMDKNKRGSTHDGASLLAEDRMFTRGLCSFVKPQLPGSFGGR